MQIASFSLVAICLVDINEPTSCVTSMRVHACACVCDADVGGFEGVRDVMQSHLLTFKSGHWPTSSCLAHIVPRCRPDASPGERKIHFL